MKRTMQYSVGGQVIDVAEDRNEEFLNAAREAGDTPEPVQKFRVGDQIVPVAQSKTDAFLASAMDAGDSPQPIRTMTMADGTSRDFTMPEMSRYLRSPEYRESPDYKEPEQGSPTWAGIKGMITGAAEGAWEGGKAGLAKAAWALPQVATGAMRAVGNTVNLGGNTKNVVGNALVNGANAADEWMERTMPTSTAERLGYEDWGTKTGDFFGGVSGMAVKFAPMAKLGPVYLEAMLASDGINAYANAYDMAKKNGLGDLSANGLGVAAGLVNYFGGKYLLKAGGVGDNIANPIIRELVKAGVSGGVMGAQGAANKVVENVATNKAVGEGVVGAAAEGFAEGAAFHGANAIPRIPKLVRQTKEHYTAAREWILDAAQNDPAMLSDLMPPALKDVIKARQEGKDVSRKMGEELFLPNNMSGEQRNAVVDAVIAYRSGEGAAENARAERSSGVEIRPEPTAQQTEQRTRDFKDATERAKAEKKAQIISEARKDAEREAERDIEEHKPSSSGDSPSQTAADALARQLPEDFAEFRKRTGLKDDDYGRMQFARAMTPNGLEKRGVGEAESERQDVAKAEEAAKDLESDLPPEQPAVRNDGRGGNADLLQQTADQYAREDANGAKSYAEWRRKNGKEDTEANRMDWFVNDYTKEADNRLSERSEDYTIPEPTAKDEAEFARKEQIQNEMDADMLRQYELDVRAREQERRNEEKAKREAEAKKYDESERKRIEAEKKSEETLQPQEMDISVSKQPSDSAPLSDIPGKEQWPEYKEWLKNNGRDDTAKSWNRFVMENELDPNLRVDTKDQQAYSEFRQRIEGDIPAEKPRRYPKDQEKSAAEEEHRGAAMRMNRDIDFRKLKDAGFSDEDAGYYLTYGKEAYYAKRVAEWEARKAAAQKQGKKFDEPKPVPPKQMEFDFGAKNETKPTAEEPAKPAAKESEPVKDGESAKTAEETEQPAAEPERKPVSAMTRDEAESHLKDALEKAKNAERALREAMDNGAKPGSEEYEAASKAADDAAIEYESAKEEAKKRFALGTSVGEDINGNRPDGLGGSPLDVNVRITGEKGGASDTPASKSASPTPPTSSPSSAKPDISAARAALAESKSRETSRITRTDTPSLQDERASLVAANDAKPAKTLQKRIAAIEEELKKRGASFEQRTEAERMEDLRSDSAVKTWAEKRGFAAVDGRVSPRAVVEYLRDRVEKAKEATKRMFSDADVVVKDREWNEELDGNSDNTIRSPEGRVVGTFDPATKKVTLYRGADEKTVYHELIGHGVEDWARRNNSGLHSKLMELARTAPRDIVDSVRSRYPDADEATIAKEIIARIAEGKGIEHIALKDAPKTWYAKTYVAVRDAIIGFMQKIGLRDIDLSKIDDLTPTEAMDYLMKEIGKGKTLGRIGASDASGKTTLGERWANAFYDRHTSLGKLSKEAAEAKALQPGREADFQVRKFDVKKKKFKDILRRGDVSINEVDEYIKAVAAKERNAADGRESSGMSNENIERVLDHYKRHSRINAIKEAADFLWEMQEEGMQERIRSGLVSESEYAGWKRREEHHVPFRSALDEKGEFIPWGRGISGPEFERHEGRYSESGSPSAWMFEEYANAHLRAIENDARKVLADAVAANPSIGRIGTDPSVRESHVKGDGGNPNVVSFKTVNDNGESVTRHVVLDGERGAAAASSYTNRDLANRNPLVRKTQAFMRFWSATATEWSPTFALRNTFADNIDLATVVLTEKGLREGSKWLKDYAKNRLAVRGEVWRFARDGEVDENSSLGQMMKEGGLIGGFAREGYDNLARAFSPDRMVKEFAGGGNRLAAVRRYTTDVVKALNSYAELMTRVSAYKTNIENGMSAKDAAIYSRRISVDFNRRGNLTPVTNTLFMFSNSTIGATMRQLEALNKGWRTPQGRRVIAGIVAFGVAEALAEHFVNADIDEENAKKGEATGKDINEHTRKTSVYARVGGRVFRAPVHEDPLMKIKYVANATTRLMMKDMSAKDYAKEVGGGIVEDIPRFFGQGTKTLEAGFNTWVPTGLQPIVQMVENLDYAGRPIYRPKYDESIPDSQNGRKSTSQFYKWAADAANSATGGNKGRAGSVDIAPETLKLISESVGKNAAKDVFNMADVGWNLITGNADKIDSRRTPAVRDVMRKTEGNDNRYFSAVRRYEADKHEKEVNSKGAWDADERREYLDSHPWLRKNGTGSTRVDRLVNGYTANGMHINGINDLRRMEGGEKRMRTAKGWQWRPYEWTEEQIREFRAKRLEKQAKVLEIMGDL